MSKRQDKGRIEGQFIPVLKQTWECAAWRAMSPYARLLYIALKGRYSFKLRNNGRIYLSTRQAGKEIGLNRDSIARCFRELQYYGFIVQTNPGCLGVEGRGKAPHWRLTALGYMLDPPTRDFMRWAGEVFHEQKPPEYYKRQERRLAKLRAAAATKKQNPVRTVRPPCQDQPDIMVSGPSGHLAGKVSGPSGHTGDPACQDHQAISRLTTSPSENGGDTGEVDRPAPVLPLMALVRPRRNGA
jgi:hypothetical protein